MYVRFAFLISILLVLIADAQSESTGSGFFISGKGHLITNHHVVAEADEMEAILDGGRKAAAVVVLLNPAKDIAILKISDVETTPLVLGDSAGVEVLDDVVAFGYPLAANLGAGLSAYQGKINAWRNLEDQPLLQMDANVNPGSSGGPVVNEFGDVIGITVSQLNPLFVLQKSGVMSEGVKFAIPIDEVKSVVRGLAIPLKKSEAKVKPDKLFEAIKPSMALIVAKRRGTDKGGSITKGNPDEVEDARLNRFVVQFVAAGAGAHTDELLKYYASAVDYYEDGIINRDKLRADIEEHFKKWPTRKYDLIGIPKKLVSPDGRIRMTYDVAFQVEDRKKRINGTVRCQIVFSESDSLQIELIRETILTRRTTNR